MPETPSSQLRSETLDLIVDILKHPERHGDPFLVKFVTNSTRYKNGYMAISLLRSMVKELNKVPTGYIVHCALNDPDRLELSIDRTRVRLSKTFEDVQVLGQEIDPPAYVRKEVAIEEFQTADSQEEQQMMDTSNTVFKPFKPLFSSEKRASVLSVCFVNGKFYVDHLVDGRAPEDQPVMEIPQYDKPDILPLGQESMVSSGARCWNCGEEGHVFTACPEPRNQANIAEARKLFGKEDAISSGRFSEELAFQNRIAAMAPGRLSAALKDALQMSENDEPPYYPNMRRYGYPPGYYGAEEGEDQLAGTTQMRRRFAARGWSVEELSDNSSILKVYDDEEDYEATMEEDTNLKMEPGRARLIKLVHYPGLDLKLRDDAETQQLQYAWYQYYSSHYPELVQYSPDWISGFEYHSYPTTSNLAQSQQHSDDKNHLSAQSNMNNFTGDESDMEISDDDDDDDE